MKYILILFLIFLVCLNGLYANMTVYSYGNGGMLYPIKSADLSMEKEKINIDVYGSTISGNEYRPFENYYYIEYNCYYQFKNNGDTQDFLLGFPVNFGISGSSSCPEMYTSNPVIADFQLYINEKSNDYSLSIHGDNPELIDTKYDVVYGFTTNIKKGESINIEVIYSIVQVAHQSAYLKTGVNYILKSGSTLKYPIGKANIEIKTHFPVSVTIKESPGEYNINESNENSFKIISWELLNFKPLSDIVIVFNDDSPIKEIEYNDEEIIKEIKQKKSHGACFPLILGKQNKSLSQELKDLLVPFYKYCLNNERTSANIAGFILSDIIKNPELSPGEIILKKISAKLKVKANDHVNRDINKIKTLISDIEKKPQDITLKTNTNKFLDSLSHSGLNMLSFHFNFDIIKNNYFLKLLHDGYKKANISDLTIKLASLIQSDYFNEFNRLIENEKDNIKEIINFIKNLVNGPEHNQFQKELENKITKLTLSTWNNKNKLREAIILEKLLHIMHLIFFRMMESNNDLYNNSQIGIPVIFFTNRDLLRKAYYSLGNFYFGKKFEKSIFFYKIGIIYGKISPLLDYLTFDSTMCGGYYSSFDNNLFNGLSSRLHYRSFDEDLKWKDSKKRVENIKKMEAFLNTIYKKQEPWWKILIKTEVIKDFSEKAISELYTPERLLNLNLSAWTNEPDNAAPCFYFSYNLACAYSRTEQGKESLNWLKVSFLMNKKIKDLAIKDKDLKYIRENYPTEFKRLLIIY